MVKFCRLWRSLLLILVPLLFSLCIKNRLQTSFACNLFVRPSIVCIVVLAATSITWIGWTLPNLAEFSQWQYHEQEVQLSLGWAYRTT